MSNNSGENVYSRDVSLLLKRADEFVQKFHSGQVDKQGEDYILHLRRVSARLVDPNDKVVGLLHDVLEDTPATPGDLYAIGVSFEMVDSIVTLTRKKGIESYAEFIKRIEESGDDRAIRVKLADLRDNLRDGVSIPLARRYSRAIDRLERFLQEKISHNIMRPYAEAENLGR